MEPGELIASGRDGDIFEYGPGRVLRKTRDGRSIAHEARIIEYVAEHGYPVPRIDEVRSDGTAIVMERIDGPLMLEAGAKGLAKLPRMLGVLADLHDQLHEIRAPEWLPRLPDGGDRMLHLDLHPLNVINSPTRGFVVIDWGNAHCGDPLFDVALTYVLLTCPRIPVPRPVELALDAVRRPLVGGVFARRYRGRALDARIAEAAELKCFDRNMSPEEVTRMRQLAARMNRRRKKRKALG
jgi:aminoglycoside phosphotransferase (APT) family kinase protein